MTKSRRWIVDRVIGVDKIVTLLDMVACVWPEIEEMKSAVRKRFIVEFLREVEFIEPNRSNSRGEVWVITDEFLKAIKGERSYSRPDYREVALRCISKLIHDYGRRGAPEAECYLYFTLGQILLYEDNEILMWLRAEIQVVQVGVEELLKLGIGPKAATIAIKFTLRNITILEIVSCRHHYVSRRSWVLKRLRKKRQARRQATRDAREEAKRRRVAELIASVDASANIKSINADMTGNATEAVLGEDTNVVTASRALHNSDTQSVSLSKGVASELL